MIVLNGREITHRIVIHLIDQNALTGQNLARICSNIGPVEDDIAINIRITQFCKNNRNYTDTFLQWLTECILAYCYTNWRN